ncbi:MAG: DUF1553 domain-containing protein [Planctomycetota bacterium]
MPLHPYPAFVGVTRLDRTFPPAQQITMPRSHRRLTLVAFWFSICSFASATDGSEPEKAALRFFENRIRPVLVEHCYECHSADASELGGSLMLDSADGMRLGGDSGPAVMPGDSDASMLISALKYESSEMPPEGKLPEQVIADFEKWVAEGAIDPRKADADALPVRDEINLEAGRQFWAFQPLVMAEIPRDAGGPLRAATDIDAFLNQSLVAANVTPNAPASPAIQLRRLSFDLTGLPPSWELQSEWLNDPSPAHWARIVDRLLMSPAFGEHWARHWMDVARYADSNGSDFNATHHEAYRYRDYLIESFAMDRPLDEMVQQQIAGDLLPFESGRQRHVNLVATTFLMLGTKMLSERDKKKLTLDVVDEQIDTIGRAFMGLTLGCARCHDHKFDPIPTEDYYALAGILKSTVTLEGESQKYVSTWHRQSLPTSQEHRDAVARFETEKKSLEKSIKALKGNIDKLKKQSADSIAGYLVDDTETIQTGKWTHSTYIKDHVGSGYLHDNNANKGAATIRFEIKLPSAGWYVVRAAHSGGPSRAAAVPVTVATADGEEAFLWDQTKIQQKPMWSTLGRFRFTPDVPAAVTLSNAGTQGYVIADAIQFLPESSLEPEETQAIADRRAQELKDQLSSLETKLVALENQHKELLAGKPDALPEAMAPRDLPTSEISDSPVHIRGEPDMVGELVPRGFLQVCGPGDARIHQPRGSGRLELARWLTDPDHPLVARVFVNRIWMHLMGEGIVRTVDNFGLQGDRPSHPELLDYLAIRFIRGGWHLKPLIREIVLTEAYQRSSDHQADADAMDTENRLWWRMPRRRLTAESIRDAMVFATGRLDPTPRDQPMAGRGVLVSSNGGGDSAMFDDVSQPVRSVYLPVVRGYVPAMMTALDVADPDLLVGRRPTTNVPSQALVLINSPDIQAWARQTAKRILDENKDLESRLEQLFALCFHRPARSSEYEFVTQWLRKRPTVSRDEEIDAWQQIVASLFASTPYRYLD